MLSALFANGNASPTGCGMGGGVTTIVTADFATTESLVAKVVNKAKASGNAIVLVHIGKVPEKTREWVAKNIPNVELIHIATQHEAFALELRSSLTGPLLGTVRNHEELTRALSSLIAPSGFPHVDKITASLDWKSEFEPLNSNERASVQATLNLALIYKQHQVLTEMGHPQYLDPDLVMQIAKEAFIQGGLPALTPIGLDNLGPVIKKASDFAHQTSAVRKVLETSCLVYETDDLIITSGPNLEHIYAVGADALNATWQTAVANGGEAYTSFFKQQNTQNAPVNPTEQRQSVVIRPMRRHESDLTRLGDKAQLTLGVHDVFVTSTCGKVQRVIHEEFVPMLNRTMHLTMPQQNFEASLQLIRTALADHPLPHGKVGGMTVRDSAVVRLITYGNMCTWVSEELLRHSLKANGPLDFYTATHPVWACVGRISESPKLPPKPSIIQDMPSQVWRLANNGERTTVVFTSSFDALAGIMVTVSKQNDLLRLTSAPQGTI